MRAHQTSTCCRFIGVLLLAVPILLVGCNGVGSLFYDQDPAAHNPEQNPATQNAENTAGAPTDTHDPDTSPLFTDPPLPTYPKSPRPGSSRSPWEMPECVDWVWHVDEIKGMEPLARISSLVVVGSFQGYGPGRWNTPKSERPVSEEYHDSTYNITIVRDIEIDVEVAVRGSVDDLSDAYVAGGSKDCDSVRYDNMPELDVGSRWVFFLNPIRVGDASSEIRPELIRVWSIDRDDMITTDSGAPIRLDQFRDSVESTPYSPTKPFG